MNEATLRRIEGLVFDWLATVETLGSVEYHETAHPELREYQREICSGLRRAWGVSFNVREVQGRLVLSLRKRGNR